MRPGRVDWFFVGLLVGGLALCILWILASGGKA